jgi:hypothetical protein
MFHLLLGSILLEYDQYLMTYTFQCFSSNYVKEKALVLVVHLCFNLPNNFNLNVHYTACYEGPSHHDMACPWVADDLQIWMVAANILNKQSQADGNGWCCRQGVRQGINFSL